MSHTELDLTRNYDFFQDLVSKVDGQATLLQSSGYYQDSIDLYEKKISSVKKISDLNAVHMCLIRKGDAMAISGDYKGA